MVFIPTGCIGSYPQWITDQSSPHYGGTILTDDEIRSHKNEPMISYGSHCVTHRPLPTLAHEAARDEIFSSKADLEEILGREAVALSFPHGSFEHRHISWAREAGYRHCFSISPELAFSPQDQFVVGRVRVDPSDWPMEFRLKLLGGYRWLSMLKALQTNG
jgi:peptidoglycan/xylan/chitin deacetylase (PgdA/CDA1 family)